MQQNKASCLGNRAVSDISAVTETILRLVIRSRSSKVHYCRTFCTAAAIAMINNCKNCFDFSSFFPESTSITGKRARESKTSRLSKSMQQCSSGTDEKKVKLEVDSAAQHKIHTHRLVQSTSWRSTSIINELPLLAQSSNYSSLQ